MTHGARINGTQADIVGALSGRPPWGQQKRPGHNPYSVMLRWSKVVNKLVMKCYIQSDPGRRGCLKRMVTIWAEEGVFETHYSVVCTSEQQLVNQARAVKVHVWLSDVEIED